MVVGNTVHGSSVKTTKHHQCYRIYRNKQRRITLIAIKPTIVLKSTISDKDLQFYRQMALEYCELNITEEEMNLETVKKHMERFRSFGIEPVFLNVMTLQKNDIIDLNLTEKNGQPVCRDDEIAKYIAGRRRSCLPVKRDGTPEMPCGKG